MAKHAEEGAWDKLSAIEAKVEDLEAQQEYLTAMQSITEAPTTISIPSAVIAALVKSGNICNNVSSPVSNTNNPSNGYKPTWRKVQ